MVVRTVGPAAGSSRRGTRFVDPFLDSEQAGVEVELGEPASIDGRPTHRLMVRLPDGFEREYLLDAETYLVVAERQSSPFHAFGEAITTETRVGDYRWVGGVLFPFRYRETAIATGRVMTEMQWGEIRTNVELPTSWFAPPVFSRTRLQAFLENLYGERTDEAAVLWSYGEFRRAYPEIDTAAGVEMIGYQMLKMGDHRAAIALLERNQADHPDSAAAAFSLGRAYATDGQTQLAREALGRAIELDPENRRAAEVLGSLE